MTVEVWSHPDFARLHPTDAFHPERPERLAVLLDRFRDAHEGREASDEELRRCHDEDYLERVRSARAPTRFDPDTWVSQTTWRAARLAAGTAIEAVRSGGFALVRPPGHHALARASLGFCIFGSVAVAARAAQDERGLERIAIVDWDVHHGNGTQALLGGDPRILFVSLHQWPWWPGSGGPEEQSETVLNVPLPAGCGDREYARVFTDVVEPRVQSFDPELVIVSAGFDPYVHDPLGGMAVTAAGFRELAARCSAVAPRVAAVLEGGYDLRALPELVEAALDGFSS